MLNNKKITEIEKKIPDITGLVTKTNFNTKVSKIEKRISNVADSVRIENLLQKTKNICSYNKFSN